LDAWVERKTGEKGQRRLRGTEKGAVEEGRDGKRGEEIENQFEVAKEQERAGGGPSGWVLK
jgi:hypothetical protein